MVRPLLLGVVLSLLLLLAVITLPWLLLAVIPLPRLLLAVIPLPRLLLSLAKHDYHPSNPRDDRRSFKYHSSASRSFW